MLEAITPVLFYWMFVGFFVFHMVVTVINLDSSDQYFHHQEGESALTELAILAVVVVVWPLLLWAYYMHRR